MSDVSAVVLSQGEPFTARALASLERQTLRPDRVILVEQVAPFSRALNEGARQVSSPYFVQVDADMVLDPHCIASLRAAMRDGLGIVAGELRDPLQGQVVGIKLFRTECFRHVSLVDSVAADSDFVTGIKRLGWGIEFLRDPDAAPGALPPAFGDHLPDYTPAYTFRKHLLEGRRYSHRGARPGLRWRIGCLERSRHPLAPLAQLALAHGFFIPEGRDGLKPGPDDPRAEWLVRLLGSGAGSNTAPLAPPGEHERLSRVFRRFAAAGRGLARASAGAAAGEALLALDGVEQHWRTLVAKLGLGHGLLSPDWPLQLRLRDQALLEVFLTLGWGGRFRAWHVLWARGARQRRGLKLHGERLRW